MKAEKSWLTCKEISIILDCTHRNVINLISRGKLSAKKDENGKYFIDKSEFYRVFPDFRDIENQRNEKNMMEGGAVKFLEEKIRHLQQLVDERKQHNEFLKEQISQYNTEKSKMLDAINSHSRLLEYKESPSSETISSRPDKSAKKFIWNKILGK